MTSNKEEKSPSQRLRAAFFVLYQEKQAGIDFEKWYEEKIEKIIDQVKEKIDESQRPPDK